MLDSYLQISFILSLGMAIVAIIGFIPLLFIQYFIYKKVFDPTYFNSKYYTAYELSIFDSFPLFLIKTIGYIKAIVFPNTMKRKFKDKILNPKEKPVIYLLACLTILFLFVSSLILINVGIMAIVVYYNNWINDIAVKTITSTIVGSALGKVYNWQNNIRIVLDNYILISTILFLSMSVSLVIIIPLLLIQHFIYKRILDPTYFNSKYYSAYELAIFGSFPLFLIKTIGYIKAIVFPKTMRRKFKNNILKPKENPVVFLLAWATMLIIICCALILINTGIMAIVYYTNY